MLRYTRDKCRVERPGSRKIAVAAAAAKGNDYNLTEIAFVLYLAVSSDQKQFIIILFIVIITFLGVAVIEKAIRTPNTPIYCRFVITVKSR
jgi:hypothetical protein